MRLINLHHGVVIGSCRSGPKTTPTLLAKNDSKEQMYDIHVYIYIYIYISENHAELGVLWSAKSRNDTFGVSVWTHGVLYYIISYIKIT